MAVPQIKHYSVFVNGINVQFPHKPYDVQRDYMHKVIECLRASQHGLLESPTGTGKTLSLLCASLAWQQEHGEPTGPIIYSSRTHAQLAQAANEMRQTAYARKPAVVLGGREQMCLNDEVRHMSGSNLINRSCRNSITKNACVFYSNYEKKSELMSDTAVHDIEDLVTFGRKNQCCPYYASRRFAEKKASIVFTPYNYVLDPALRKIQSVKLDNSVIIFDEAHNIENILEECVSGDLRKSHLKAIQNCVSYLPKKINDCLNFQKHGLERTGYNPRSDIVDEVPKKGSSKKAEKEEKPNPILEIIEKLTTDRLEQVRRYSSLLETRIVTAMKYDSSCSIDHVYAIFEDCEIGFGTADMIVETLDNMASFLSVAGVQSPNLVATFVAGITALSATVGLVYPQGFISGLKMKEHRTNFARNYRAYLTSIRDENNGYESYNSPEPPKDWIFQLWCLNPAVGLKLLLDSTCIEPRSFIITSGTLAPLDCLRNELGLPFKVELEAPHVIDRSQMDVILVSRSPTNKPLVVNYENLKSPLFVKELGDTIVKLIETLPHGVLLFFSSYGSMNRMIPYWKKTLAWNKMMAHKDLFVEPKSKEEFSTTIASYKRKIDENNRGAVFFGICRGKLSEGINLYGNYCRTVIVVGLPFPSTQDPRVNMKKEYCDQHNKSLPGRLWYMLQMQRALNQTIGRAIRSSTDIGLVLLCDERYSSLKSNLSKWIQPFYNPSMRSIAQVQTEINKFFVAHKMALEFRPVDQDCGAFQLMADRPSSRPITSSSVSSAPRSTVSTLRSREMAMLSCYAFKNTTKLSPKKDPPLERSPNNQIKKTLNNKSPLAKVSRPSSSIFDALDNKTSANDESTYSILNQTNAKSTAYKCYVCLQQADVPLRADCICGRIACRSCWLGVLKRSNSKCGQCNSLLKFKHFKRMYFESAVAKHEKVGIFAIK
ncbi:Regulator of telomere elongation helicase 1-like protein, partial [Fragariocoptes setiger]